MGGGGAPPHTDNRIRQAARGQGQVGLFKTTRERRARSPLLLTLWLSWTWLEHLWNSAKLRPPTRAGPLDSQLENQPFMKSRTVPMPHHGATTAEQSRAFPVTSRSRGSPKEHEPTTWHPKQRTELTRENEAKASSLLQRRKQVTNQTFLTLTKLVKFDLNAVTEQRHLSWSFPVESSVKIAKRANFNSYEFTYQNPLCMCMFVYYQLIHLC